MLSSRVRDLLSYVKNRENRKKTNIYNVVSEREEQ